MGLNLTHKSVLNLGSGDDILTMARAMNMTDQEKRFIDKLKVGHGIVKLKVRFDEPIHVRFPWVNIKKRLASNYENSYPKGYL
ncbi:hypothetical protein JYT44_03195 [Caldithrix abyssi]|nr:hypothetical protein [Caldithrix abyssi]